MTFIPVWITLFCSKSCTNPSIRRKCSNVAWILKQVESVQVFLSSVLFSMWIWVSYRLMWVSQPRMLLACMLVILDAGSLFIREDDGHTTMVICGSSSRRPPMGIDQPRSSTGVDLSILAIIPKKWVLYRSCNVLYVFEADTVRGPGVPGFWIQSFQMDMVTSPRHRHRAWAGEASKIILFFGESWFSMIQHGEGPNTLCLNMFDTVTVLDLW